MQREFRINQTLHHRSVQCDAAGICSRMDDAGLGRNNIQAINGILHSGAIPGDVLAIGLCGIGPGALTRLRVYGDANGCAAGQDGAAADHVQHIFVMVPGQRAIGTIEANPIVGIVDHRRHILNFAIHNVPLCKAVQEGIACAAGVHHIEIAIVVNGQHGELSIGVRVVSGIDNGYTGNLLHLTGIQVDGVETIALVQGVQLLVRVVESHIVNFIFIGILEVMADQLIALPFAVRGDIEVSVHGSHVDVAVYIFGGHNLHIDGAVILCSAVVTFVVIVDLFRVNGHPTILI